MQKQRLNVILSGVNGYGLRYLRESFRLEALKEVKLRAIVDPSARLNPEWGRIQRDRIPRFDSLNECLQTGIEADLVVIASPLTCHADQSCAALEAGMNVLCEKPISATLADAQRMLSARNDSGHFLEIGYQWSFSAAIQQLKADLLAGRLGTVQTLRTKVGWPRGSRYYRRNDWAGHIYDAAGRSVFDSPVNNATAHFLHNMLFVTGAAPTLSATPKCLEAECYRGNEIENFDTACCRVQTYEGAEILFFSTHCVKDFFGPQFCFVCEDAIVEYAGTGSIRARLSHGGEIDYGSPDCDPMDKFRYCLERCRNPEAYPEVCGVEAAMAHTLCVQGIQLVPVRTFSREWLRVDEEKPGDYLTSMPSLATAIHQGYDEMKLFSEMNLPWAIPSKRIELPIADCPQPVISRLSCEPS